MMDIDISQAESKIRQVLPDVITLSGEINTLGSYLLFDAISVNEAGIGDVDYEFRLFIAISSKTKAKQLVYEPISEALTTLITHWQSHQQIAIGKIKPFASKRLIVYQIPLTVRGFIGDAYVGLD